MWENTAHCCVYADSNTGMDFIISSATAYLSTRGFSYVSHLDGEGLARLPRPRFYCFTKPVAQYDRF